MHSDNKSIELIEKHKFDEKSVKIARANLNKSYEFKNEPRPKSVMMLWCTKGGANRSLSEKAKSPPVQHAPHAPDFHIDKSKTLI